MDNDKNIFISEFKSNINLEEYEMFKDRDNKDKFMSEFLSSLINPKVIVLDGGKINP